MDHDSDFIETAVTLEWCRMNLDKRSIYPTGGRLLTGIVQHFFCVIDVEVQFDQTIKAQNDSAGRARLPF